MKKALLLALAALATSAAVAGATGTLGGDNGRRLSGPFCVGDRNARPVGGIPRAGVVRSVAARVKCRSDETRKIGVAVPAGTGKVGPQGPAGPAGKNGKDGATGPQGPAGSSTPLLRLTGNFLGTNASVATSLDGVQFGPYSDGGAWGGSVEYTGANGLKLSQISELAYTIMHSTADNNAIAAPYLRIFLSGDTHDVIFDPTKCATVVPPEDTFATYEVTTGDVRYDDDACSSAASQMPWATVVAAHGDEIVSGIYVTTGFAGGSQLTAILRTLSVNGTPYTFGAP